MTITQHENLDDCIRTRKRLRTELDTANETILNLETELAALGKRKPVELLPPKDTILPGVPAYFELKQKYDKAVETIRLQIADLEALNKDALELIEEKKLLDKMLTRCNNETESQAECIRNMENELQGLVGSTAGLALIKCNEKRRALGDQLREAREIFNVEEKNSLDDHIRELKKELKELKVKYETEGITLEEHEKLTQLKEAVDPGILEGCKIRVRELVRERTKLQEDLEWSKTKFEECESGSKEITKDLFRLNDENKDYIETIRKLQVEIKVFEESYNHIHNQLKQLVIEVEELSK